MIYWFGFVEEIDVDKGIMIMDHFPENVEYFKPAARALMQEWVRYDGCFSGWTNALWSVHKTMNECIVIHKLFGHGVNAFSIVGLQECECECFRAMWF